MTSSDLHRHASALMLLLATLALGLSACGGGDSSSPAPAQAVADSPSNPPADDPPADDPPADDPPADDPPPVSTPSLKLAVGDFWEYGWDTLSSVSIPGGSSTTARAGRFRLTLDAAVNVAGRDGYTVRVSGEPLDRVPQALATEDDLLLASYDGSTWATVFSTDASWVGGGWFLNLPADFAVTAFDERISNDYLDRDALAVGASQSSNLCEVLYGLNFCTGATTYRESEYYDPAVGVIAYRYQYDTLESGLGGAISNTRINVGLIASSLQGDTVNYALEVEPNDSPLDNAVALASGQPVLGGEGVDAGNDQNVEVVVVEYPEGATVELEPNDSAAQATPASLFETIAGTVSDSDNRPLEVVTNDDRMLTVNVQDLFLLDFSALPVPIGSDQEHGDCPTLEARHNSLGSRSLRLFVLAREGDQLRLVAEEADDLANGFTARRTLFAGTDYLLAVGSDGVDATAPYAVNMVCSRDLPSMPDTPFERVLSPFDWYEVTLTEEGPLEIVTDTAPFVVTAEDALQVTGEAQQAEVGDEWVYAEVLPAGTYRIGITNVFDREYQIVAFY